jgi:T5SS/PEP-CTERM-associated repeat protein
MQQELTIGGLGNGNRLVITNGGSVRSAGGIISSALSSNNEVIVTGAGSSWVSPSSIMFIGQVGSNSRLTISDGGTVSQLSPFGLTLGSGSTSTNSRIVVDNGTLTVTNGPGFAPFDIRRGRTILNAGLINVDIFRMTNTQGFLDLNGGTFSARNSLVSNGTIFRIGDGTNVSTFRLAGNGLHQFSGILVARVSSNATFTGNGTIAGAAPLQFLRGSLLAPGASVGRMIFSNSPSLQGTIVMEIAKDGATLTHDHIQVASTLTYGGTLIVSNLGPTGLDVGDRYQLFGAASFAGSFSDISLPPLAAGLNWTNRLLIDGSIEVVGLKIASIEVAGGSLVLAGLGGAPNASFAVLTATNVAEPLSNWVSIATRQFDAVGRFSFTNAVVPGIPQRFFQIRTP